MNNYLDITKTYDDEKIKEFSNIIKDGGIGIFPTETVYAIGGNGLDASSVEKIYNAKNRNKKNPINLLVNSIEMVETVAKDISPIEYKLMQTFFPGPFTIILKKKDIVPDIVTAGSNYVGVRMSSSEIVNKLIDYAKVPIAAPSANISGRLSGTNLKDIYNDFSDKVDFMIDGR